MVVWCGHRRLGWLSALAVGLGEFDEAVVELGAVFVGFLKVGFETAVFFAELDEFAGFSHGGREGR